MSEANSTPALAVGGVEPASRPAVSLQAIIDELRGELGREQFRADQLQTERDRLQIEITENRRETKRLIEQLGDARTALSHLGGD